MALVCASCGFENAEGARFCSSCGSPLAPAATRKERKFATALFADLVGSTALAEHEDPEVVQSVVGRAFDRLAEEVERYGGLLEKFMGDAVLAVFGVPTAHEDDPERAVRAGLEMQAVLSELNRGFADEGKPQLAMRVGVEAGEVLVDLERASGPRDRMLTGDAVNTAARIQSVAEPGHVIVGPAVQEATRVLIDYRDLPPVELKGKAEPVPVWDALRVKARRGGERASFGLQSRLVGRDEELSVLKQTLNRVESEGRPALVTVLGPAGVGKSRLARELLEYVEKLDEFVYWRTGRCTAYGGVSYSALAEAAKAQCEILEDDSPEVAAAKVERAVEELFGDGALAPPIKALVGAGAEGSASREDLFDAWRRFLERMASRYPLVLVLEDIQWADVGLLDFVDHLADWGQGPILILTLARPELLEIRPGWGGGKRNYAAIYLDPLSPEESEEMLDDLLHASLPDDVRRLVVGTSEGNPLFTEEIIRMLIDRGLLREIPEGGWEIVGSVEEVEVPRSMQGLIAARLDSLPQEEKAILQDASVVGRVFWTGAAATLSATAEAQARELLGRLRIKEIIVPRDPPAFSNEHEFAFRHALIRDVAYESLPKTLRATKHADVARWAEGRVGDRREEMPELVATHYSEALRYLDELGDSGGDREDLQREAFRWARLAAERAVRLWQLAEAVRWYRKALDLSEAAGAEVEEQARLWEAYGDAASGIESYEEVGRAYEEARRRYEDLGLVADLGRIEGYLAYVAFESGLDEDVLPWIERALGNLEPLGDGEDLAKALHWLGWYHWRRGHLEEAEGPLRRSREMAARVGARVIQGVATQSLGVLFTQGPRWREGLALVEESFEIARETGSRELLLRSYINFPATLGHTGDLVRMEALLTEGLELARKSGNRNAEAWLLGNLGDVLSLQGRLEEAEACFESGLQAARDVSNMPLVGGKLNGLGRLKALRGELDEAERLLGESEAVLQENPEPQMEVWLRVPEALLAGVQGRADSTAPALVQRIEALGDGLAVDGGETLLGETVRLLMLTDRRDLAETYRDRLWEIAWGRPPVEAVARWADGLVADAPAERVEAFQDAAARFDSLNRRIDHARCLLDQAAAQRETGEDPRPALERAHEILAECGATLFLREAEAALADLPAGSGG